MIGLKRGMVEVVPSQADWNDIFTRERQRLLGGIGHLVLDIQHVGSTAVPGLPAKPIIDIAAAVATPAVISHCRPPLLDIGYLDRGDLGADGGYLFVKEMAPDVRTVHLHVVVIDDPQWQNYLRFRDTLRADEALRRRYGELKASLLERFAADRPGYSEGKREFIERVLFQR